jgi:hypothetical protein
LTSGFRSRRLGLLRIIKVTLEMARSASLIHQVFKRLIVDTKLIPVAVLNDRQAITSDRERELEGALIADKVLEFIYDLPVVFINDLTILHNLLFAGEHRIIKLDRVVFVVETELPNEKFLGSILMSVEFAHLRRDRLADVANIGVEWLAAHCID